MQISGTTLGTFTNSGGTLAVTFNSSANTARVASVLDQITYANSSDAPAASVQVDYLVSEGNAGTGPGRATDRDRQRHRRLPRRGDVQEVFDDIEIPRT